jgi:hypothetical protein
MKKLTACLVVGLMLLGGGCKKKSDTGGEAGQDKGFHFKIPRSLSVSQDKKAEFTIDVSREKDYSGGSITFTFEVPEGLNVREKKGDNKSVTVKSDDDKALMMVEVGKKTKPGEKTIKVTATPEKGKAVSETFTVKVVESK